MQTKRDNLLSLGRGLTILVRVFLVLGMIGLGIGMAGTAAMALGYLPEGMTIEMAPEDVGATALWVAALAMLITLCALGLMYDFVKRLGQIIDTVGQGDPFITDNADRLTRMAWLAMAVELVLIPATILSSWAEHNLPEGHFELHSDVSLTCFILAVILFILARVFRKGAEMRAELEGTV